MDDSAPQFDTAILRKAGLTDSQAKGYLALVEHGELSPAELATNTGESRTNGYMIADKLVELGLATKKDKPRLLYEANHPSALETLAEKRRRVVMRNEQEVKQGISPLIELFYAHTEQPGTYTLQGVDGIKTVLRDILATKDSVYLVRTRADSSTGIPYEYFVDYRQKRADLGIHTYALTPKTPRAVESAKDDEAQLFHRTWFNSESYTAPVEIDVYGNKVALISYGGTQMATVIQSPLIAEAMRQLIIFMQQLLDNQADS